MREYLLHTQCSRISPKIHLDAESKVVPEDE